MEKLEKKIFESSSYLGLSVIKIIFFMTANIYEIYNMNQDVQKKNFRKTYTTGKFVHIEAYFFFQLCNDLFMSRIRLP